MKLTSYTRNTLIAAPLLLATLIPFVLVAHNLQISLSLKFALLGAIGWWLALILRVPFILISKNRVKNKNESANFIIALSGPCEELVRLAVLAAIGITSGHAFSVGLGWAGIEILYTIVQAVATGSLAQRTDEKAKRAIALLRQQGMEKSLESWAPFLGIIERIGANAIHIGFSLLIVFSPWVVIITVPVHSSLNFLVVNLGKKSLMLAETIFLVLGLAIFAFSVGLL